jgi:acyl-CoA thioesterase FadM
MAFQTTFETRHTDTYAATPFVHAGVLLSFTEMTYARLEEHLGFSKPEHIVSVQRETRAVYSAPLHWRDGATVEVSTTQADAYGFTQEFTVRSTESGTIAATFIHRWAWLDTETGRRVDIPGEVVAALRGV